MFQDQLLPEDTQLKTDLIQDARRYMERRVVIKRFLSYTATTNQLAGQTPQRNTILIEMSVGMRTMQGKELLSGGGIYNEGDLEMSTQDPVFTADNRNNTEADRMIVDGVNYKQVGFPFQVPHSGGRVKWVSHWHRDN